MKLRLLFAFIFFAIGSSIIIDWLIFWNQNYSNTLGFEKFIAKYLNHFPVFLKPLFIGHMPSYIGIVSFTIAGILFIIEKKGAYKALGITAFILVAWNLFTLM